MAATQEELMGLLDKIIERYRPGGEFGKGELALLEREKTKSLARTQSGMVSAGLAGTTVSAGAGQKWEEEVGMPAKLQLEDIRSQRLMESMRTKAGFAERESERERQERLIREQREFTAGESLQSRQLQRELARRAGRGAGGATGISGSRGDGAAENFYAEPAGGYSGEPGGTGRRPGGLDLSQQTYNWGERMSGASPEWRAQQEQQMDIDPLNAPITAAERARWGGALIDPRQARTFRQGEARGRVIDPNMYKR